jgi:hypothetical protein
MFMKRCKGYRSLGTSGLTTNIAFRNCCLTCNNVILQQAMSPERVYRYPLGGTHSVPRVIIVY